MNLHEYQAKQLLRDYDVPVLDGFVCHTPLEAKKAAVNLGSKTCVVKAQVHAGGRGKAGGVKLAKDPEQALDAAQAILGMKLVTAQTGKKGKLVRKVLVEEGVSISKEYYLSFIIDRSNAAVSCIASAEGGMEIEKVAKKSPEKVLRLTIRPEVRLRDYQCRRIGEFFSLDKAGQAALTPVIRNLYRAFLALDCQLLEINPLVLTDDNRFVCLDAKASIDDNALFRQPAASAAIDYDEMDERELRSHEVGISYIALEGNIGCMVNGAGLAMATMDIIEQAGGKPANFLDVGGTATPEMVSEGFRLILQDTSVKGILVNIFGGIVHCDVIAKGVIDAAKTLDIKVPVVVRLRGTNVEVGKKLLADSGLKLISANDMAEAATKIVAQVGKGA